MEIKPIINILEKEKIRGLTYNDNFFKNVDYARKKYIDNETLIIEIIWDNKKLERSKKIDMLRAIGIIYYANADGLVDVQWDELFNLPILTLHKYAVESSVEIIKRFRDIANKWDVSQNNLHHKRQAESPGIYTSLNEATRCKLNVNDIIVFLEERKLRLLTYNTEFFKNVDYGYNKYINNSTFISQNIVDNEEMNKQQKLDVLKAMDVVYTANEEGVIDVQWDNLFSKPSKKSYKILIDTSNNILKIWPKAEDYCNDLMIRLENKNKEEELNL